MSNKIKLAGFNFHREFSWPLIFGLLSAIGTLIWTSWQPSMDPDTHMHIAIGRCIYENWAIPKTDIYSHTLYGKPWAAHEWLSELIFFIVYRLGGWTALVLLMALALATSLALTLRFLLSRVPPVYAIFFTALTYSALATHLLIRPHVLSWPLMTIWISKLIQASEEMTTPPWYLMPIFGMWANLHGSFVIGVALAIPIALHTISAAPRAKQSELLKGWLIFLGSSILLCSLTPIGLKGLIFPLLLFNLHHLGMVDEWMPYRLGTFNGLEFSLITYFVLALMGFIKINFVYALVIIGLLYQALTHNRYVSIFGLITPFFIAQSFGIQYRLITQQNTNKSLTQLDQFFTSFSKLASFKAILMSCILLIATSFLEYQVHRHEPSNTLYPIAAIDFVKRHGIQGPVLNSYEFGGYLISREIPVFIDGRVDLYDTEVLGPYLNAVRDGSSEAIESLVQKYNISWVLIRSNASARNYFENRQGWKRIYEDKVATIFIKTE